MMGKGKIKTHLKRQYSLRMKMTFTLTILMSLTIFLLWFFNQMFLEDYYVHSKINSLDDTYPLINNAYSGGDTTLSSEDILKVQRLSETKNVKVYVITDRFVWEFPQVDEDGEEYTRVLSILQHYFFSGVNPDVMAEELVVEDRYSIFKRHDEKIDANYVELIGRLDNHYTVYMRTNLESIQESVIIANKFLAIAGILVIFIGAIIMFYISNHFTKPILELSEISKKMTNLDFGVKYNIKRKDEIGTLGKSINLLSTQLENTISELKLANYELRMDIENKIKTDEMRKEFISNVSHELKTPIAIIQGYAEGLKENINEDEESRNFYSDVIIDEAQKMNQMVKKLISLSHIEAGDNHIDFKYFNIVAVIQSILKSNMILFKQNNITCLFHHEEPLYVWGDEYLIEEGILNYRSNAIHHAEDAKIIEIKLEQKDNLVRINVFNTGKNIPHDELDKVWLKFYKIDKARTREYGGSGIGLSIVKAIMTALNQDYGVKNYKDGVVFWFELETKSDC